MFWKYQTIIACWNELSVLYLMIQNTRLITTGWSPTTPPSSNKNYTEITDNFADFPVHFTVMFSSPNVTPVTVPSTQKLDCPVNTILSDIPLCFK